MQSRRIFIGKVATASPALSRRPTCSRPTTASAWASSGRATAARRSCARRWLAPTPNLRASPISTRGAWKTRRPSRPAPRLTSITGICWTINPSTRCSSPRRSICIASISSTRSRPANTSTRKRPWRSAWSMPSACAPPISKPAGARCRSAIRDVHPGQVRDAVNFLKTGNRGQDHGHPRAHVPQYAAWQTAVGASRVSRHDSGKHHLEILPGRSAARAISTPTAISTGASSGIIRAATCTKTCATSWPSGTR